MSLPFAKKSLGQHWLTDANALDYMCKAGEVKEGDTVLEIGPGIGTLTQLLVRKAEKVVAVEFDKSMVTQLEGIYDKLPEQRDKIEIVHSDILKFDLTILPPDYKVVANIPYYLTSNLLRTLLESQNPPKVIALLVQKEVAERVAAGPGGMSLLSVSVQYYCEVELGQIVPARLFTPPPKVDSQILKLTYREEPLFKDIDTKTFFRLVRAGFAARRKTLLNSLSGGLRTGKSEINSLLETARISPSTRPQELSLDDWYRLYRAWQNV